MTNSKRTRAHEHQVTIDAPPDVVWKAITDAAELTRWFPLHAVVEPGAGGRIVYSWPPDFEGPCDIERWEPPRHLRTTWAFLPPGVAEDERRRVAVDWILEGSGGSTVLRVVHSGFGFGSEWNDEYEGSDRGWDFELRSLQHYLERHRGQSRRAVWVRRPAALEASAGWERLLGPNGFGREGSLRDARPGDRVAVVAATGDRLEGTIMTAFPPQEISLTVKALGDGIVRTGYDVIGGRPHASVWIAGWGAGTEAIDAMAARMNGMLERLFPA